MAPQKSAAEVVAALRATFNSGKTLSLDFRRQQLKKLQEMMTVEEDRWCDALYKDLKKKKSEAKMMELNMIVNEVGHVLNELNNWTANKKVSRTVSSLMDSAYISKDPLGVILCIGPWNYPVQLMFMPLIGAIAAGNCVLMKPSELSVHTSDLMAELIPKYLDPSIVSVVLGGIPETTALLKERYDHILYTGATPVGKVILRAAAEHLTPVTLELGGKSPTIIGTDVDLAIVAKRIAWGKWTNCGQTCIAPDYVLCTGGIEQQNKLIELLKECLVEFYGEKRTHDAESDYGRIINQRHFDRLSSLITSTSGKIEIGGVNMNRDSLFIEPTVITGVTADDATMNDEIFGPILPILTVASMDAAVTFINRREKPLALYVFTNTQSIVDDLVKRTSSGAVVVNDIMMHAGLDTLPFGGVGHSGMGRYHGQFTFDTFSHEKAVLHRGMGGEKMMWVRYPPYNEKKDYWGGILTQRRKLPFILRCLCPCCCK